MECNKKTNHSLLLKVLFMITIVSITINIILCGTININKKRYETSIKECISKRKSLDGILNVRKKELDEMFDKYYSDKLRELMGKDDLVILAQKQWNYVLTVNGKKLRGNTIYITDNHIKIVLAEFTNKERVLPKEILMKGTLTGGDPNDSLDSHLKIISQEKYNKHQEEKEGNKRIIYEFNNIPRGTIITLKLSEILKSRLNLDKNKYPSSNEYEIVIR
ncbi:hypothetical protein CLTEP_13140 [Clostridium tepidiprofundi DSM 19306]|uniref:Uncharacterized protein n=1 Tax=Clostridium tepidiprofundi DSM 19306 TaxID=1121338 RepID=A0A151B4Y4_9CLOT|nr:hypothetical protein [Clostridium tepidiprofundi]KYH34717.1 hypothetical protein CLTEP_13140 [Clostridium tepidiprofundi DSM 19306]